jgi:hypothetical protein
MIYPVEAIDDLWNLPADEFRAKYAGINITGLGPSDEGWYVRYKHENLTCLFGPMADREEARRCTLPAPCAGAPNERSLVSATTQSTPKSSCM